ncbi:hypothetical protein ACE7GA_21295 [Roseomonas sp. CCTCC AB2023176]|uniref:hypothetical protein n=1 Tax=Roseomonas sp. CCTCC AB2023176 TaxID=3342640 RepID=UPI0035DFAACC
MLIVTCGCNRWTVVPIAPLVARWPGITAGEACRRLRCLMCRSRPATVTLRHPRGLNGEFSHADLTLPLIGPGARRKR